MKAEKYKIDNISIKPGEVVVVDIYRTDGEPIFDFKPGQYAMLMINDENGRLMEEHPFSIASSPSQKKSLQFGIKMIGRFTRRLAELKQGAEVYVLGPFGNFVFNPEEHKDSVFIAGGVGITPFMSAFRYALYNGLQNKLTLLYSARTIGNALYFEEIKNIEWQNKNFKAYFAITDEEVPTNIARAKKCFIDLKMIWEAVDYDVADKRFFICGPPGFMEAMINCIKSMGVSEDKIFTEKFSMVPSFGQSMKDRWFKFTFRGAVVLFLTILAMIFFNEKEKLAIREELEKQKEYFLEQTIDLSSKQPVPVQPQIQEPAPAIQATQPVTQSQPQQVEQPKPAPTQKVIVPRTTIS